MESNQVGVNRTANFTYVVENVGCGGLDKDTELPWMQDADARGIVDVYNRHNASENRRITLSFGSMVDDKTIFSNWTECRARLYRPLVRPAPTPTISSYPILILSNVRQLS